MVNWNLLQNATSPDNKPTPGWQFHEICQDVRGSPKDVPDVAEYLMQCVCSDQLNIQLKAVLAIKHLSSEDITFQQYMQACHGAIKILEDIAAPPIVPQARSLEPLEVKTVREATQSALTSIATPHTVEKQTESASLKSRIQGFGNFEPPPDEIETRKPGIAGQVGEFVADSIGDMVDDFKEKGAVGALKDATVDALDLVLDGVDSVWGWVVGQRPEDQPRICQPAQVNMPVPLPGCLGGGAYAQPGMVPAATGSYGAPIGIQPPPMGFHQPVRPQQPKSASNAYAAAFGGAVVGANNPVMVSDGQPLAGLPGLPGSLGAPPPAGLVGRSPVVAAPAGLAPGAAAPATVAAPTVDLLSMDEPVPVTSNATGTGSARTVTDLLDIEAPSEVPSSEGVGAQASSPIHSVVATAAPQVVTADMLDI